MLISLLMVGSSPTQIHLYDIDVAEILIELIEEHYEIEIEREIDDEETS